MRDELYSVIEEFPRYDITIHGRVYNNKSRKEMKVSQNNHGHAKINLTAWDGTRHTRSVAVLVAEAFVEAPNLLCDQVIILDGDFTNVTAENLAWRPRWFAWKYTRQLKEEQPSHFRNLEVWNTVTGDVYENIIEAGIAEGLLFEDIWRSTYSGNQCFPTGSVFEVS